MANSKPRLKAIMRHRPLWIALSAITAAIASFTLYEAFLLAGKVSNYSLKFQSLQTQNSAYNATREALLHYNTIQLGWALGTIVSMSILIIALVMLAFFTKNVDGKNK